jgi:ankyrin repeat protein
VQYLLVQGAEPNGKWKHARYPLHHALARSNGISIIKLLLDYGADPRLVSDGLSAISRAAREGRSDVLDLFAQKGIPVELKGVDQLIGACAMGDGVTVQAIIKQSPSFLQELMAMSSQLLARFCLNENEPGVQQLLEIGVDVNTPYDTGDGYFGIPEGSLPIHVAAWLGHSAIVKLLIEKGSLVDVPDQQGQTPLALAVKACVDSYWTDRCTPDSVKALLDAGASVQHVPFPSGYPAVDELLHAALGK